MCFENFTARRNCHIDHLPIALQIMKSLAHISMESSPRQQILINVVMLIHFVQELLIDVFQVAFVCTHSDILLIVLNVVDICVTACAISAAIYASLARRTIAIITVAHQISVAI